MHKFEVAKNLTYSVCCLVPGVIIVKIIIMI